MKIHLVIFSVLLLCMPVTLYGQQVKGNVNKKQTDSLTATDTARVDKVRAWELTGDYSRQQRVQLDTLLQLFNQYNPVYNNGVTATFLGNIGQPAESNTYFLRGEGHDFVALDYLSPYMAHYSTTRYYNTLTPYTDLNYTKSGGSRREEQTLGVLHTQNITPYFNAGLSYHRISSVGQYQNQTTRNSAFSLFSSYQRAVYSAHLSVNINSVNLGENGGVTADSLVKVGGVAPETIPVRLSSGASVTKNQNFLFVQSFNPFLLLGRDTVVSRDSSTVRRSRVLGQLTHVVSFDRSFRLYNDQQTDSSFYQHYYLNAGPTADSVYYRRWHNSLRIEIKNTPGGKFNFNGWAGISVDAYKYSFAAPNDTMQLSSGGDTVYRGKTQDQMLSDWYVSGGLYNRIGDVLQWNARGRLYLAGYNAGSLSVTGQVENKIRMGGSPTRIVLEGGFNTREPRYLKTHYYSNHYAWDNRGGFKKQIETRAGGYIERPKGKWKIGADYRLYGNYVYYDTHSEPQQSTGGITVLAVYAQKSLRIGPVHTINRVVYQKVNRESVLSLPLLSLFHTLYYEHYLVKDVLNMQVGYQVRYNTAYMADAYNPALGVFYNQQEKSLGNYPYVNAYINLKLKRTRLSFQYTHVNQGWPDNEYFTALHYPMTPRLFTFAINWTFYN